MPRPRKTPVNPHTLVMPNFAGPGYNNKRYQMRNQLQLSNDEVIAKLQQDWNNNINEQIRTWDLQNQAQALLDEIANQYKEQALIPEIHNEEAQDQPEQPEQLEQQQQQQQQQQQLEEEQYLNTPRAASPNLNLEPATSPYRTNLPNLNSLLPNPQQSPSIVEINP